MHERFKNAADRLIKRNGRDITLQDPVNTGDQWNPDIANTEYTVKAVQSTFTILEKQGGLVQDNDVRYLIEPVVPVGEQMKIVDNGKTLSIVDIQTIMPGDRIIGYKVHARA